MYFWIDPCQNKHPFCFVFVIIYKAFIVKTYVIIIVSIILYTCM